MAPRTSTYSGVPAVPACVTLLQDLLSVAETAEASPTTDPPLEKARLGDIDGRFCKLFDSFGLPTSTDDDANRIRRFAIIETAARDLFSACIATISIESPEFVRVWNLLDIIAILSNTEQCDPALLFWLVEELLDSQTISGCRRIFDFLESRREAITAKHFKQKQLIILRTCTELLRRLSRAEDTAFCGRVFIFLFQSFPLGDKSSVNLRGEYHVENVTTFDQIPLSRDATAVEMDADAPLHDASSKLGPADNTRRTQQDQKGSAPLSSDALYPVFWGLQAIFKNPKKLFEPAQFSEFKAGVDATLKTFQTIKPTPKMDRDEKSSEEAKRGLKRRHEDDEMTSTLNPKYLTSRDLFELEISDLWFRRSILVQMLIVMEFLLSLSTESKEKLSTIKTPNKSVTYADFVLAEDDIKWGAGIKSSIADYLKQQARWQVEGHQFYRTVETILTRDKNWARWKVENCPLIAKPAVTAQQFSDAKASIRRATASKRLRAHPISSLSLDFLADVDKDTAMARFKNEERHKLPALEPFRRKIVEDDLEIDMPTSNESKAAAVESKASKSWRALRLASRTRLSQFDKIDNPDKIDVIFVDPAIEPSSNGVKCYDLQNGEREAQELATLRPADTRPVVVAGPRGVGKSSLITRLLKSRTGVFRKVVRHTTRPWKADEANAAKDFQFVDVQTFNMMRDGDQLIAFRGGEADEPSEGTSRRALDAVVEAGKVPLLEMDCESAKQIRDFVLNVRLIFVRPPSLVVLESRLKEAAGLGADMKTLMDSAVADMDDKSFSYDTVIVNGELDGALAKLDEFIYGAVSAG